ncbi:hypothetical protein A8C56_10945 [Niabella ginsenosidivorans]|uniref:Uncharacterized protein n=1 Tax=Niabella ginsenosidivorans TaxID=1176587 RepID=A0A1A9I2Z5_9BACT|nr:hypothetical protein [Niabella ginsenosidivorans]ANH81429.1 hypothetical protein A8C56_10945 [Niabella ginsenosidivorans]
MKQFLLLWGLLYFLSGAHATPTKVTIRVKAKDAKFIGTAIGGAAVVIRDNRTGALLASGITTGTSGDTKSILQTSYQRYQSITDDKTAGFVANIDIDAPTFVDIEVVAPVSRRGSAIKGSTQIWVIPGKDILGDGIILELPGLILDILNPTTHQIISSDSIKNNSLPVRISLTMLCGCPISKGGVWNANDFEVKAVLKKEGSPIGTFTLQKAVQTNIFEGNLPVKEKGNYQVVVYAFQSRSNNSGVDLLNFVIQ